MKTEFSIIQLADPKIKDIDEILRKCVHCGFCLATCPTYNILGDELDSPRGRIYQIKSVLEDDKPASPQFVKHMDRCLSCLSCVTTCPSGVDYMHLIDHMRGYIEKTYKRPFGERSFRYIIKTIIPNPRLFHWALWLAYFVRPFNFLMPKNFKNMLDMAPKYISKRSEIDYQRLFLANGKAKKRVAFMNGCAQKILSPNINQSTINILRRMEVEIIIPEDTGCCGALTHHMGDDKDSHAKAIANIKAWVNEMDSPKGLDSIIVNASGCGTMVKDYGHMFKHNDEIRPMAERVSAICKDITEFIGEIGLPEITKPQNVKIAYHSACSMQHGQKITDIPSELLKNAGFEVLIPPDGHLCCGSAGSYNLLQPKLSHQLLKNKSIAIGSLNADMVATGNIGCITQISRQMDIPIVHIIELLDWVTGGSKPKKYLANKRCE